VGQIVNLRPIGNRPLRSRATGGGDYQSPSGCHPALHFGALWLLCRRS